MAYSTRMHQKYLELLEMSILIMKIHLVNSLKLRHIEQKSGEKEDKKTVIEKIVLKPEIKFLIVMCVVFFQNHNIAKTTHLFKIYFELYI